MTDLIDALLATPGIYAGTHTDPTAGHPTGPARIEITALPGGGGVAFDYESVGANGQVEHREHAVLARTTAGLVLMTTHSHAPLASVLTDTAADPGYFSADPSTLAFPMAIRITVPEPGHLVYTWSYGRAPSDLAIRDIATVTRRG